MDALEVVARGGQGAVDTANIMKRLADLETLPPRFSVHADAQAGFTLDQYDDVTTTWWGSPDYAVGATFDGTSWTITSAGVWLIMGSWAWASNASTGMIGIQVILGSNAAVSDQRYSMASQTNVQGFHKLMSLANGDVMKMRCYNGRGSGQQNSSLYAYQYFQGVKLA